MAESDHLTMNSSVAPAGIRAGHAQDESSDRWCGRWSTWSLVRIGPAATDELGVPAQQRSGDTSRIRRKGPAAACSARSARRGRASSVSAGHWSSAIPRPRAEAPESRHPWRHRSARGAPASSARDPTSGRRVRRPQRAITLGWLWTKTVRSACHKRADQRTRPMSSQAAPNDDRAVASDPVELTRSGHHSPPFGRHQHRGAGWIRPPQRQPQNALDMFSRAPRFERPRI
jgi:hypothetical protein